jgi:hypothetical protein
MLVGKSGSAIKCMAGIANAAEQQSRILGRAFACRFPNCGGNGPDDILKFP